MSISGQYSNNSWKNNYNRTDSIGCGCGSNNVGCGSNVGSGSGVGCGSGVGSGNSVEYEPNVTSPSFEEQRKADAQNVHELYKKSTDTEASAKERAAWGQLIGSSLAFKRTHSEEDEKWASEASTAYTAALQEYEATPEYQAYKKALDDFKAKYGDDEYSEYM